MYLPVIKFQSEIKEPEIIESVPKGTERILIVDDENQIVRMERLMLERLGYQVTVRTSSIEALKMFQTNPNSFDLVITDMTMPKMTGDRLSAEIISINPKMPVIICTGFSEKMDPNKAAALGIKGFLMKPIVKSEMAKTVRNVLDEAKDSNQG